MNLASMGGLIWFFEADPITAEAAMARRRPKDSRSPVIELTNTSNEKKKN